MNVKMAVALSLLAVAPVFAGDDNKNVPELVPVQLQRAFIPVGFDNNDHVQIVVSGEFPDTCHKLGPVTATKVAGKIEVKQQAYRYGGVCMDMVVPFNQVVDLDLMSTGRYEVKDMASGKSLGDLPVMAANRPEPDDFPYAPVAEALILEERGGAGPTLYLTGNFPNGSMRIKDVKVLAYSDVLVVQPIVEKVNGEVDGDARPRFEKKVPLKALPKGKFLLHVRSMNGKALNTVEEIEN